MIHTWPTSLPKPTRAGFQKSPQDLRRKRGNDAGVPAYSKRTSLSVQNVALRLILDRGQEQVFDRFYHQTLSGGVHRFWMPDPTSDGWPLCDQSGARLLSPQGETLLMAAKWLCLMGDEPPVLGPLRGLEFPVSFSVLVLP